MLIHLETLEQLEKETKEGVVLVDFFATWCGPCKMLAPELEELAEENSDIKVIKVDVDQANSLASKFNIRSVPTLFVFKDGQLKKERSGCMDKDALLEFVKNA